MVLVELSDYTKEKSFPKIFFEIMLSILMLAGVFTASRIFHNLFCMAMKTCNVYDFDNPNSCSLGYTLYTHGLSVILIALVIAISYQMLKRDR